MYLLSTTFPIITVALSTTGDGIISALQVLCAVIESGNSLADLKKGMSKYPQVLLNVPTPDAFDKRDKIEVQLNGETFYIDKSGKRIL